MRALSVLRVLRRSNLTSSALLRGAVCRSFASTSDASSTAVVKPTVSGVPASPNVKTIRKELLRALDSDVNDLSANQDENITQYMKDNKFQIFHNETSNQVYIARMVGDTFIEARFEIDPDQQDQDQDQNEDEEGQEEQETEANENEEQDGEGQEEDDISLDAHSIQIVISKAGGNANATKPDVVPSTILIESHVDSRGFLHVDSILAEVPQSALSADSFHPLAPKSNETALSNLSNLGLDDMAPNAAENSMDFNELGDATKDHFYRYLEALGMDDQFGQFVQHYAQILRTQNYVKRMQQLRNFMA